MSVEEEYRRWQERNPNFITPDLVDYDVIDGYVVELSKGTGIKNEPIYGVSLLEREGYEKFKNIGWRANVTGAFYSLKEADKHFKRLADVVESCQMYSDDEFIKCLKGRTWNW